MKKTKTALFLIIGIASGSPVVASELAADFGQLKEEVQQTDVVSREVMSTLYQINRRMKSVSRKRNVINDSVISTEAKVRSLTANTRELSETIANQRRRLSKRLRTLYMLGEDKVARAIFSAGNSEDLQQTLKYLKIFSDQDYGLIRTYESNLAILQAKQKRLDNELRRLLTLRQRLQAQEELLVKDQGAKTKFLGHLSSKRGKALSKLKSIRTMLGPAADKLLDLSFFDHKGRLSKPFAGRLVRGFGMIENPVYGYQLSHKGNLYESDEGRPVRAVYQGVVSYAGDLDGHGQTVILDHGDHYYSVYAGLDSVQVSEGEEVSSGQSLAESEGKLYFEIRHFSDPVDPMAWLANDRGES